MTSKIFEDFFGKINIKMKNENRNVLILIDNAPSHPNLQFSTLKFLFLPLTAQV